MSNGYYTQMHLEREAERKTKRTKVVIATASILATYAFMVLDGLVVA